MSKQRLTAQQVRELDPYAFLAVLGKRVIHPGGRASTDRLLEWAAPRMARAVPYLGYIVVAARKLSGRTLDGQMA